MEAWVAEVVRDLELVLRLVVAMVLAGLLGWERESKDRPAGLRTHMVVGVSAALFVVLGDLLIDYFGPEREGLRFDPIRIIEATVTGISFLGAGTIFLSGENRVRGLTTAASLLATAGVGMAVGLERYALAVGTTVLLLIVLSLLRRLVRATKGETPE